MHLAGIMRSLPLLKFNDETAFLAPEGLEAIKALPGRICPIIFVGDGRGGKSYLASRVLGADDAFVSSDTCEPVTEGIDMIAVPVQPLLADGSECTEGEYLLMLDCEGGNNAMAAIRTLVNVFGIVLGTEVVFVANGMASEQALQNLGASLAARSLIRLDGESRFPEQRLIFVVNKNTLKYEASALEKILDQKLDDPGRQELRDSVRTAFPERQFFAVPLMGMPRFEETLSTLRAKIIEGRKPLTMGGAPVHGEELCGLLELIVSEVQRTSQVSFMSMNRFVIFDGFLAPLVRQLAEEAQAGLPRLEDWDADLESKDPRKAALQKFDEAVAHIAHKALVDEARTLLDERLSLAWAEVERANNAFGEQIQEVVQEQREVIAERLKSVIGGKGLLKKVTVTKMNVMLEIRAVIHRKRGGEPECSPWAAAGALVTRMEESAFNRFSQLPVIRGTLQKRSPNLMRAMLKWVNVQNQGRICILQDGHFLWWTPEAHKDKSEAKGCINFLIHHAEVVADKSYPTIFTIRPANGGWSDTTSFTGGGKREFHFSADDCEVSRDQWVAAISKHIEFGNLAREQLGEEKIMRQVGDCKPTVTQLES